MDEDLLEYMFFNPTISHLRKATNEGLENGADKKGDIRALKTSHEKKLHLIGASRELTKFDHAGRWME